MLLAFERFIGTNDMLAYLSMMAPRLVELHRVLKHTGSLYLHCDPTASHYLKLLLDAVFGPNQFRNEVVWKRSSAHNDTKQGLAKYGRIHDVLLFYTKTDDWKWHPQYTAYTEEYLESEYRHVAPDGRRYKETDCTAAKPGGDVSYEWHVRRASTKDRWEADLIDEYEHPKSGVEYRAVLPYNGRYWAYSRANLIEFAKTGHLIHRRTGMPRLVQYADEMPGIPLQDMWSDISPVGPKAGERLGYQTQKPVTLLERIIMSSSDTGDTVLDPFCGCGTTISAAQRLGRRWIGIDITTLAINLIETRLLDEYQGAAKHEVLGEPTTVEDAAQLARENPYQFQWWALRKVGARPDAQKKGADRGIDGRLYFHDGSDATKEMIFSVKAGKLHAHYVRDLAGVRGREKAEIGVLISLDEPTKPMRREAASAGFYDSPWGKHPRLQILTIAELLEGKQIDYPRTAGVNRTFKRAPRVRTKTEPHPELFDTPTDAED